LATQIRAASTSICAPVVEVTGRLAARKMALAATPALTSVSVIRAIQ
jgi:hypothetical protein